MSLTYTDHEATFADRDTWTMPDVLRTRAETHADRVFLDCPEEDRAWTYAETLETAERVAGRLVAAGASPGDRLVIMAMNSSSFVFSYLGCALAAGIQVPINVHYRGQFFEHQVGLVEPRFAVADTDLVGRFADSASACTTLEVLWVVGDQDEVEAARKLVDDSALTCRVEPITGLLEGEQRTDLPRPAPRDVASVFFTSGTTGPSKGVMMPHAQMYFFADETASLTRLTDDDAYMTTTPLFHGNAQFMAVYPAMVRGARAVVRSRFSASRWIDQVRESRVTVTNFVGVMMDFVWKQDRREDDADNPLRCVFAAPTAWSVMDEFKERFRIDAFVEVFGLTETSAPIISPYGADRPDGAAGLLASDWFEVRLVDPKTDEEVQVGEVGELVVRPRYPWTCSLGYWAMPDKTAEAWRNLWFHTGDGLRRDQDGWFYFVDRMKDALRRRGENISSYEIEQGVLGLEGVLECAVVAAPADVEAGEDEVLAVVVTDGTVTPKDFWSWCDHRLPSFAVPRYLRLVNELPRTPSEKVRKASLREAGITPDTIDRTAMTIGRTS